MELGVDWKQNPVISLEVGMNSAYYVSGLTHAGPVLPPAGLAEAVHQQAGLQVSAAKNQGY